MKKTSMLYLAAGAVLAFGFSGAAQAKCGDGKNRRVTIVNDTSYALEYLYGSNVGTDDWEEDVLGDDVLRPGQTVSVNWDDGTCSCLFDFKAVFNDNTSTVRRSYNVCTGSSWRIHE